MNMGDTASRPDPTLLEGWLHRSHRSHKGDSKLVRRYFVSDGFFVEYRQTADDPKTRTGKFDLRNVTSLDEPAPGRLTFYI